MACGRNAYFLLFALGLTTGCADTARQIARTPAPGGIDGALEALSRPENQKRLAMLLDQPALERAGKRVARGAVAGVNESLNLGGFTKSAFRDSEFRGGSTRPATSTDAVEEMSQLSSSRPAAASTNALSKAVHQSEFWAYGMIGSATAAGIRDALSEPGPAVNSLTDQVVDERGSNICPAPGRTAWDQSFAP